MDDSSASGDALRRLVHRFNSRRRIWGRASSPPTARQAATYGGWEAELGREGDHHVQLLKGPLGVLPELQVNLGLGCAGPGGALGVLDECGLVAGLVEGQFQAAGEVLGVEVGGGGRATPVCML